MKQDEIEELRKRIDERHRKDLEKLDEQYRSEVEKLEKVARAAEDLRSLSEQYGPLKAIASEQPLAKNGATPFPAPAVPAKVRVADERPYFKTAKKAVLHVLNQPNLLPTEFTAEDVSKAENKTPSRRRGINPWSISSFSAILSDLAKKGSLELVSQGSGRAPSIYRKASRSAG